MHTIHYIWRKITTKKQSIVRCDVFYCFLFSFSLYTTGLLCALMSWRDLGFQRPMSASSFWAFIFNEEGVFSLCLWKRGDALSSFRSPCAHLLLFPLTLVQNWGRGHILNRSNVRKLQALLFLGNMNKTLIKTWNFGRK